MLLVYFHCVICQLGVCFSHRNSSA